MQPDPHAPHHAPPEYQIVDQWRVSCDGGEGALGHPRVWLSLNRVTGYVECPYCDKLYVHRGFADEVLAKFGIEA